MRQWRRFVGAVLVAGALAAPGIAVVTMRAAATCRPLGCEAWDVYDFQWWYFECYLPPCLGGGTA